MKVIQFIRNFEHNIHKTSHYLSWKSLLYSPSAPYFSLIWKFHEPSPTLSFASVLIRNQDASKKIFNMGSRFDRVTAKSNEVSVGPLIDYAHHITARQTDSFKLSGI